MLWSSALHLVNKPDGKVRVCGDYRPLNDKTKLADLLGNLTEVQAALSSVKNRQHDAVKLKQPCFSGKTDPKHFFLKLNKLFICLMRSLTPGCDY